MEMDPRTQKALEEFLLAMGDDELILAHRNSEWCGHAPILEEDIAFANIAQDELGHAQLWYGLLSDLNGADPDQLVFFRDAEAYRNVRLVELPKGDWAFSILRQYIFDGLEAVRLEELVGSRYRPLAEAAAKVRKEEQYHYRHTRTWVQRLGLGTEESKRRMQDALDALWPHVSQLFAPLPGESLLVQEEIVPPAEKVLGRWQEKTLSFLRDVDLEVSVLSDVEEEGRGVHTPHLEALLQELQEVARMDVQAEW